MTEAPGILQWMIEGCLDWQTNGLVKPASVISATEEYFSDQDLFEHWMAEECRCEPSNRHLFAQSNDLYKSWKEFALGAGHPPGSRQSFGDQMARHGFKHTRNRKSRYFVGIQLRQRASFHEAV